MNVPFNNSTTNTVQHFAYHKILVIKNFNLIKARVARQWFCTGSAGGDFISIDIWYCGVNISQIDL